jgi:hypothetical protein
LHLNSIVALLFFFLLIIVHIAVVMFSLHHNPETDLIEKIELDLPESVEYRPSNKGGIGLFTTRPFKRGETIYEALGITIPNKVFEIQLLIHNRKENANLIINTSTHAVKLNEIERELYPYDSFMNHSCDPTTESVVGGPPPGREWPYKTVALRDMDAGEEITCDYTYFDYECNGHSIPKCLCGSTRCIGRVGFKYLPRELQLERLPFVPPNVVELFLADNPDFDPQSLALNKET